MSRLSRNRPLPELQPVRVDDSKTQRAFDAINNVLRALLALLQGFVQTDPWHAVDFVTGWVVFSGSLQYRKDPLGRVHLQGNAQRTSGSSGTILVLPLGYRPSQRLYFGLNTLVTATYTASRIDVDVDGRVLVASGGTDFVMLDGLSFYAE